MLYVQRTVYFIYVLCRILSTFLLLLTLCTQEIHFNIPFLFDVKNEEEIRDNTLLLLLFLLINLNCYIGVILKCNPEDFLKKGK